ncbi:MAG UNVERIFIED_CONTAM: hypothetical protein LVR29_05790 [Microcystis novacekii LVE1205-3]|jgi:6-phosphogluconate dehydrogenase
MAVTPSTRTRKDAPGDLESTTKLGFVGMGVSGGEEGALHGSFPDAGGYRVRLSGIRADFNQNCRPSR